MEFNVSKSAHALIFGLICLISIQNCRALEPLNEEQCKKIVFKEPGDNCTKEEASHSFPVLGNCTAYFKCDYVVSLAAALPEKIGVCGKDEYFDHKSSKCTAGASKVESCDQTACERILDSETVSNGSVSQKSGQYNYGPTTQAPPPHQHTPQEDSHEQGRANHDDHAKEVVPLGQENGKGGRSDEGHGQENSKEAKPQHGAHNAAHGIDDTSFIAIFSVSMLLLILNASNCFAWTVTKISVRL